MLALCLLTAPAASAQPAQGALVSGAVSAMAMDSSTDFSFSVAAGYRLNRVFGLGIELTLAPTLASDRPGPRLWSSSDSPRGAVSIDYRGRDGQATIFTTNVRLEVPTTTKRVVPYATAGGGIATVKESVGVIILGIPATTVREMPSTAIYPPPYWEPYLSSSTNLALTLGGGISVLAGNHFSIDVDLRYLRLIGDRDRNIGRFGAGASYRF